MKLLPLFAMALGVVFVGAGALRGDEKEDAKKKLKALEGNWQLKRQEGGGSLTPKIVVLRLRIVIEDGEMSWYIGNPAANQTADIKVDPSKTPKHIEAEITSGSAKDKIMLGIYKLDKDTLEICWGTPGGEKRPTKFTTRPGVGAGNQLDLYEREKDEK